MHAATSETINYPSSPRAEMKKDSTLTDETARRFRVAKLPCEREPTAIRV